MIKTRLVGLLSHAKKYIVYTILWQWAALLSQVIAVFTIADLLEWVVYGAVTATAVKRTVFMLAIVVVIRFFCERMGARSSYLACVDVKRILREKIYEKMLKLGASYSEQVSSSEVVQVSTEGVEQLETYFGKYLPQLFYSQLAPLTLFAILCRVSMKASVILLICVPLIPISIVVVQKIAKKLLNKYWSIYTGLGDSFLENLQGLTTLKIYQADQQKADEMDVESQNFRRITMKVLTMQLNSTSVMDIVAYGGAAVVCVVNLRSDLKPINVHFASVGSLNEAMAHPRELFKSSILSNAASMMLIHCHPSGNVFPSKADTMMTDRMNKLCELMGIPLIDHIIVGGDNREFFSFREKGMIDNPKITLSTDYRTLDIKSPLVAEQGKAR